MQLHFSKHHALFHKQTIGGQVGNARRGSLASSAFGGLQSEKVLNSILVESLLKMLLEGQPGAEGILGWTGVLGDNKMCTKTIKGTLLSLTAKGWGLGGMMHDSIPPAAPAVPGRTLIRGEA